MEYEEWRELVFKHPPDELPILVEFPWYMETHPPQDMLMHINQCLMDEEVHEIYDRHQIGVGLSLIFNKRPEYLAKCILDPSNGGQREESVENLRYFYDNFVVRYCHENLTKIPGEGNNTSMGLICYTLWGNFPITGDYHESDVTKAALGVMKKAIHSSNEKCIESAIRGLGQWASNQPGAIEILDGWLQSPTTGNDVLIDFAAVAKTGMVQ